MTTRQNLHAPWLGGFVIAAAMGLVAFGVAKTIGAFDTVPAVAIGVVVAVLAGVVMGMPWGANPRSTATPMPARSVGPVAAPVAAPASPIVAAPAAPVMAAPAAPLVAAPAAPAAAMMSPSAARRPDALSAPRSGSADDLKIIKGIGPKLELLCHSLGFYHFDQIAAWTDAEIAWVDDNLEGFKGRVTRDRWVPQAKAIVTHGPDAFLKRLDAGEEF